MGDFFPSGAILIIVLIAIFIIIYFHRSQNMSNYADEKWLKLETVIFIKNAQDEIEGIISNYYSRQVKPVELLIVDCGSRDQTPQILERLTRRFLGLKLLFLSDLPFQLCLQEALKHTSAPALLLVDGTCLDSKEIFKLTALVSKKNVGIGLKSYEK